MFSTHDQIVQWVIDHGDAELRLGNDEISDAEIAWTKTGLRGIYSTKSQSVKSRLNYEHSALHGAVFGECGIPVGRRRQWLLQVSIDDRIRFLGDLDGTDLMSYFALTGEASPRTISYLGIGDSLLASFGVPLSSLQQYLLPATSTEMAAIDKLTDMGLSIESIVGPDCLSVLRAGKKLEVEGLFWEIPAHDLMAFASK